MDATRNRTVAGEKTGSGTGQGRRSDRAECGPSVRAPREGVEHVTTLLGFMWEEQVGLVWLCLNGKWERKASAGKEVVLEVGLEGRAYTRGASP